MLPRLGRIFAWTMVAMLYFPMTYLVLLSFSARPDTGIPGGFTLGIYTRLFVDRRVWVAVRTSVLLAVGASALVLALALPASRAFAVMRRRSLFIGMTLLPLFVPGVVIGAALVTYFRTLGIPLSAWTVLIAQSIWAFPFAFLALIIVTLRFDPTLREAAQDLGASPWRAFLDVELPLILPGLQSAVVFSFLLAFNELIRTYLVRGSTTTLPIFLWTMMTSHVSTAPLTYGLTSVALAASLALLILVFGLLLRPRP